MTLQLWLENAGTFYDKSHYVDKWPIKESRKAEGVPHELDLNIVDRRDGVYIGFQLNGGMRAMFVNHLGGTSYRYLMGGYINFLGSSEMVDGRIFSARFTSFEKDYNRLVPYIDFDSTTYPTDQSRIQRLFQLHMTDWDGITAVGGPFTTYPSGTAGFAGYSQKTVAQILADLTSYIGQPTDENYPVAPRRTKIETQWQNAANPALGIRNLFHYYDAERVQTEIVPLTDLADQKANYAADSFNRLASATEIGESDTGQAWAALVGIWGTRLSGGDGRAYVVSGGGENIAVIASGTSNGDVQATITIMQPTSRLAFRVESFPSQSYKWEGWIVQKGLVAQFELWKYQGGVWTNVANSSGVTPANGDTLQAVLAGSSISIYRNGGSTPIITATDSFNQTKTLHGIGWNGAQGITPEWDSFSVRHTGAKLLDKWEHSLDVSQMMNKVGIRGPGFYPAPTDWTNLVGARGESSGLLVKTTITDAWDAGAVSSQRITEDGGRLIFSIVPYTLGFDNFDGVDNPAFLEETPSGQSWVVSNHNEIVLTANSAVGALSLAVQALPFPIANGVTISFPGGRLAVTSAAAAAGGTTIPVAALGAALGSTEWGLYKVEGTPPPNVWERRANRAKMRAVASVSRVAADFKAATCIVQLQRPVVGDGGGLVFRQGGEEVRTARVSAGGTGYTSDPIAVFSAPPAGSGYRVATGTVVRSGTSVSSITITDPGSYPDSTTPSITISGGGGSGATAVAYMAANYWTLRQSGTVYKLYKVVAGIQYDGAPAWTGPVAQVNDILKVNLVGSTIQVYIGTGGAAPAFQVNVTDAFNQTATWHGLRATSTTPEFDNFLVQSTYGRRAIGVGYTDTGQNYTDIEFAYLFLEDRTYGIYESGVLRAGPGNYTLNDQFRIELRPEPVPGGGGTRVVVTYWRMPGGVGQWLFEYTSLVYPTPSEATPMYIDSALYHPGATFAGVTIRRFTFSIHEDAASVTEHGEHWAKNVLVDETLDSYAKRDARALALFGVLGSPRNHFEGRSLYEYVEGRQVLTNVTELGWIDQKRLVAEVMPNRDVDVDPTKPVYNYVLGDSFRELGDSGPLAYLTRAQSIDRNGPPTPTGLEATAGRQDHETTVEQDFQWAQTTQGERTVTIRLTERVEPYASSLHPFPAETNRSTVGRLRPSVRYGMSHMSEDANGNPSGWSPEQEFVTVALPPIAPPVLSLISNVFDETDGQAAISIGVAHPQNVRLVGYEVTLTVAGGTLIYPVGISSVIVVRARPGVPVQVTMRAYTQELRYSPPSNEIDEISASHPDMPAPVFTFGGEWVEYGRGSIMLNLTHSTYPARAWYQATLFPVAVLGPERPIYTVDATQTQILVGGDMPGIVPGVPYAYATRVLDSRMLPGPWTTPELVHTIARTPEPSGASLDFDATHPDEEFSKWPESLVATTGLAALPDRSRSTVKVLNGYSSMAMVLDSAPESISSGGVPVAITTGQIAAFKFSHISTAARGSASVTLQWLDKAGAQVGADVAAWAAHMPAATQADFAWASPAAPATVTAFRLVLKFVSSGFWVTTTLYWAAPIWRLVASSTDIGAGAVGNAQLGVITDPAKVALWTGVAARRPINDTAGVLRGEEYYSSGAGIGTLIYAGVNTGAVPVGIDIINSAGTSSFTAGSGGQTDILGNGITLNSNSLGIRLLNAQTYTLDTLSASTTLSAAHYAVMVDATAAARTITLPASGSLTGRIYIIKKIDSSANAVTIDGNASETIDGALTKILAYQHQSVIIQSDGTNWKVLAEHKPTGLVKIYKAHATASSTVNPEPTSDTLVNSMSVTIVLAVAQDVLITADTISNKVGVGHSSRFSVYDALNGGASTKIAPDTAPLTGWYSIVASGQDQQAHFMTMQNLAAGSHVLTIKHQANGGVGQVIFYDRTLRVDILD